MGTLKSSSQHTLAYSSENTFVLIDLDWLESEKVKDRINFDFQALCDWLTGKFLISSIAVFSSTSDQKLHNTFKQKFDNINSSFIIKKIDKEARLKEMIIYLKEWIDPYIRNCVLINSPSDLSTLAHEVRKTAQKIAVIATSDIASRSNS